MSLYSKYAGKKTFIGRYMALHSEGESPESYDFWSAIWVLSSALGREVIIDRPNAIIYMNQYIILVANSGITRKSTAVNFANKVLAEVMPKGSAMLSSRSSAEGIELMLVKLSAKYGRAHLAINISELATFVGKEPYTKNIPALLTDIYDCPYHRANITIARGDTFSRNVYPTFISASTPSWLETAINPAVVEGGFTSRVLFILEDRRKQRVAWAKKKQDPEDYGRMVRKLRKVVAMANRYGSIVLSRGAMRKYTNWYQHKRESVTPFLASFESREDSHVLRLAALLAISSNLKEIQTEHVTDALKIIADIKSTSSSMFEGGLAPDGRTLGVNALLETLVASHPVGLTRTQISKVTRRYIDTKDTNHLLEILHELEMVNKHIDHLKTSGRRPTYYKPTQFLLSATHKQALFSRFTDLDA
jgi:hypothetical protein